MDLTDSFDYQKKIWTEWGQADPFWAILSDPSKKGGRWQVDEFFQLGEQEIEEVMKEVGQHAQLNFDRALDFGCGVGRLSRALGKYFKQVVGVDVSEPMINGADTFNTLSHVEFVLNQREDLSVFEDNSFDFVYSRIVLQHIPSASAEKYISEFMRILKPGGIAYFQVPSHPRSTEEYKYFQANIKIIEAPASMKSGQSSQVKLHIKNTSSIDWKSTQRHCFRVGNHWYKYGSNDMFIQDDGRASLPGLFKAGEETVLSLRVTAPPGVGIYSLKCDIVQEGVAWFADANGNANLPAVSIAVRHERGNRWWNILKETVQILVVKFKGVLKVVKKTVKASVFSSPVYALKHFFERTKKSLPRPQPEIFRMYPVAKSRIEGLVKSQNCEVLAVQEDFSSGVSWMAYFYLVRKP